MSLLRAQCIEGELRLCCGSCVEICGYFHSHFLSATVGEHPFLHKSRVKNKLKMRMTQRRLNMLSLVAADSELVRELGLWRLDQWPLFKEDQKKADDLGFTDVSRWALCVVVAVAVYWVCFSLMCSVMVSCRLFSLGHILYTVCVYSLLSAVWVRVLFISEFCNCYNYSCKVIKFQISLLEALI